MFVKNAECTVTPCEPGVSRKILAWSDALMMVEVTFEAGASGNIHGHVHEQVTYVGMGRFDFTIDGETREVGKGDSVHIPSGAQHGVKALEAGILVDVFNPKREEFLK